VIFPREDCYVVDAWNVPDPRSIVTKLGIALNTIRVAVLRYIRYVIVSLPPAKTHSAKQILSWDGDSLGVCAL
jgi:hypothetical protein